MYQSIFNKQKPWSSYQVTTKSIDTTTSLYLLNNRTGKEITLKLIPDSVAESYSPKIVSKTPFGVLRPLNFYTGGSAKTLSFSFDLHEDLNYVREDSGGKNLYKLLDEIKELEKPDTNSGVVLGPSVYLQLGKQFAGDGFITVNYDYKGPFRNSRYIYTTCSIEFTYTQEYEMNDIKVFEDTIYNEPSLSLTDGSISFTDVELNNILKYATPAILNTLGEPTLTDEYFVSMIYEDVKIQQYYNLMLGTKGKDLDLSKDKILNSYEDNELWQAFMKNDVGTGYYYTPGGDGLLRVAADIERVIRGTLPTKAKIANLKKLIEDIHNINNAFSYLRDRDIHSTDFRSLGDITEDMIEVSEILKAVAETYIAMAESLLKVGE